MRVGSNGPRNNAGLAMLLGAILTVLSTPGLAARAGAAYEWTSIHSSPANQRYVPFDQINRSSVARLGAVWISEPFPAGAASRMTPLVHAGLMLFAAGPRIMALDARSGKVRWTHQTETRASSAASGFEAMISGLAITRSLSLGLGGGMVFTGMMNGHVIALRAQTGELLWDRLINEEPLAISKSIASTPLYVDGVLYFGFGTEFARGRAVAVDATSGREIWRTWMVPQPGEPGHESWPAGSNVWRNGGGHPWAPAASDPSLGLVYFVTGNPGPLSGGGVRPGDNLYNNSVVALEMATGKMRWHQQLVHHDIWELDLGTSPVLFDWPAERARKAIGVMRADGYVFVFDRATGEPLIPLEERPVPQNPQLATAPTQPFPRGADSILQSCESWQSRIPAGFTLGCMFQPPATNVPNLLAPLPSARLAPLSYSPQTGYFYVQGQNALQWREAFDDPYFGAVNVGARIPNYPKQNVVVAAVEARTGKIKWQRNLPTLDEAGYRSNGGALSTAGGLVFHQGGDGTLQAYAARTGKLLWSFQTDYAAGDASPMSYVIDGKQYVAFIAGSKVWAFALGGTLPAAVPIAMGPRDEVVGPIEEVTEIETATLETMLSNGRRYRVNEHAFTPYRARVRVGTPLSFINNGQKPLTILARDGSWSTRTLDPTEIATLEFDKPGTYVYFAKEYPWAYGQLIVAPADHLDSSANAGQVSAGKAQYVAACSSCHGQNLEGRDPAPALQGRAFGARWAGRNALDLFDRIRTTMPPTAPRTLSEDQYEAIVAYILHANGVTTPGVIDKAKMKGTAVAVRAEAGAP